jgi:hypothetical protein
VYHHHDPNRRLQAFNSKKMKIKKSRKKPEVVRFSLLSYLTCGGISNLDCRMQSDRILQSYTCLPTSIHLPLVTTHSRRLKKFHRNLAILLCLSIWFLIAICQLGLRHFFDEDNHNVSNAVVACDRPFVCPPIIGDT